MAVYQGSIEASEKALQNAKETLYETLFNSDMLKSFNNGLADILEMFKTETSPNLPTAEMFRQKPVMP